MRPMIGYPQGGKGSSCCILLHPCLGVVYLPEGGSRRQCLQTLSGQLRCSAWRPVPPRKSRVCIVYLDSR